MRTIALISLLGLVLPLSAASLWAEDENPAAAGKQPDVRKAAIERLIEDLASDDYKVREAASKKLAAYGEVARPMLERAVLESESVEVRSRADQLLQRLKGTGERPLGADPRGESPGSEPGTPGSPNEQALGAIESIKKWMAEWSKGGAAAGFGTSLFGGPLSAPRHIEAPGLRLDRIAPGRVELTVQRDKAGGAPGEDVFRGSSLRDILSRNTELETHAGMGELKRREAESSWPGYEAFLGPRGRFAPLPGGGISFSRRQGVSIQQDANGVTVRVTEPGEDGKPVLKEYKGKSIEELKKKHPELKDKLGGFSVQFRVGAPNFFWPNTHRRGPKPLPQRTPGTHPRAASQAVFGLRLAVPDEALSSHLGLEPLLGALVVSVLPNSQAEAMGFKRHDLIVKVNSVAVSRDEAWTVFRMAARVPPSVGQASGVDPTLTVEVIRRGEKVTLKR